MDIKESLRKIASSDYILGIKRMIIVSEEDYAAVQRDRDISDLLGDEKETKKLDEWLSTHTVKFWYGTRDDGPR